jgi:polysaccharide deacetylase family protein (PEP-CTERM system associated)
MPPTPNFLTFDIEEWYMGNYDGLDTTAFIGSASRLEWEVDRLIEICANYHIRATCFVVGSLADKQPALVKRLQGAGHEIASHSHRHQLVHQMSPSEFREDLRRSIGVLQEITGQPIAGYRAPSWSVTTSILPWYYAVLEETSIRYSSSVYPGHTYLYGISGFPQHIHRPVVDGVRTAITEIPQRLTRLFGKNIGFAGGFYFRLFPLPFILHRIRQTNRHGHPLFIYLHPREIDPRAPRLPLRPLDRLVHYWAVASCEHKFINLLTALRSPFVTMADYVATLPESSTP